MNLLAVDPGPEKSALVWMDNGSPVRIAYLTNGEALEQIRATDQRGVMVCEWVHSQGMPVGAPVFLTCLWVGAFLREWHAPHSLVLTTTVRAHVCGTAASNDTNIRRALLDRYGDPTSKKCVMCHGNGWRGRDHQPCPECVTTPGWERPPGHPLEGWHEHHRSALAVGCTYHDRGPSCGFTIDALVSQNLPMRADGLPF